MARMVHEVLRETVKRYGERPALRAKRGGRWHTTSWSGYQRAARRAARALIGLGVEAAEGVAIIGFSSPEWVLADVGAILAGAVPAGIYTTSTPAQVRYITDHCEAKVAFADTAEQVEKFVGEQEQTPRLEVVVQMLGRPKDAGEDGEARRGRLRVITWERLLALGDLTPEQALDERLAVQRADDPCTLIYTSGTTGEPKAVMITHTNVVWTAGAVIEALAFGPNEVLLSYLPLSHVAEQMLTIHGPMGAGALVYFAESMERLAEGLREVQPTIFLGVPRVWEKIQAKMTTAGASAPPAQRRIAAWARKLGLAAGDAEQRGAARPLLHPVAKRLVFDKVRERLGLARARMCLTSAAPIARSTLDYFLSLGIPILEVYGMSECTGPATLSTPDAYRTGTCGVVLPGAELRIAEDGEVCLRGPHVFKGYLKDAEATAGAIDAEGWLHSGDIGTLDERGFLRITDRKKDLLITAGGENVAPQLIEGQLKAIPAIAQAVVVGDRKKYLAALLTLDPSLVVAEAERCGSPARTAADAARCEVFRRHLEAQIEHVNAGLARVQTVKRFVVLAHELSIEGGELTPTMKVKRKVVGEKYAKEIAALYSDDDGGLAQAV